jgi:hypothetical protein
MTRERKSGRAASSHAWIYASLLCVAALHAQPSPPSKPQGGNPAPSAVSTLYQAARSRNVKEARKLLDQAATLISQGDGVHERDVNGRTPLHWTAIGAAGTTDSKLLDAYAEITDALIGHGVDVNRRDDLGLAPMDWLPAAADSPIAIMLHDHGGERAVTGPVGAAVSGLLASLDEAVDDGDISKIRTLLDVSLPALTEISIRLASGISSHASRAGDVVDAVVTVPVAVDNRIVVSAGASLRGTVLFARRARDQFQQAHLNVHFGQLTQPGLAAPATVLTRLGAVDNARESVADGWIIGIPLPQSKVQKIKWASSCLGWFAPGTATAIDLITNAFTATFSREIDFPPGVEMTVVIDVPQRLDGTPHSTGWPTFSPDSELDTLVRAQPLRSTTTHGAPADLTNVVLVGSHDEVAAAFAAAGWTPASEANLKADFRTFIATMEQRKYARAPVFNLLLDGKLPQFVFEKQTDTFAKRHHVRLYAPAVSYKGAPVWVATGTHDIGIGSNAADTSWFHRIDTHVDRERTKIVNDLMFSGFASVYGFVDRPGTPPKLRNATGDDMYTDGRVAVVLLKSVPAQE